jgi:multiple sugar transport system ATP-binding protein
MPRIELRSISKTYPDGTPAVSDLDLSIGDGEFLCILGPSGCGKSSTLRMLAGLEGISAGDLLVDGQRINELPAQARDMAMVFENYALYPHLDVYRNIAMPLVARRVGKREIQRRVEEVCRILRLTEQMRQRPRTLSGGQRQRVALGRALIRRPRIFLMDEPLGHLEAYLRVELRAEIRRLHEERRTTTVYITHDQEEAGAVADRIAVMNAGRLQQLGSLPELIDHPVNRFVALFVGERPINLLPAQVEPAAATIALRLGEATLPLRPAQQAALAGAADGPFELGVRPDDLGLVPAGTPHCLPGRVLVIEPQGDASVVVVETSVGRVGVAVASDGVPDLGAAVGVDLAGARIHLFAADGANLFAGIGGGGDQLI